MTKLYLEPSEKVTLEYSLMESKVNVEQRIEYYTDKLNSSTTTEDVNLHTYSLRIQKSKLELINQLLNKLL
jgi:hypothetical protein|tara:strand:+ start:385 stop:597 length:213 start_codon:yes stop_codon:yes gene_type:complete